MGQQWHKGGIGKEDISEQSLSILLEISINYIKMHIVIPRRATKKITLKYTVK